VTLGRESRARVSGEIRIGAALRGIGVKRLLRLADMPLSIGEKEHPWDCNNFAEDRGIVRVWSATALKRFQLCMDAMC
jgi:hypothetical protein